MSAEDIISRIKGVLSDRFEIDAALVNDDARFRDLGLDSMHLLDVMLDMESDLGIRLQDLNVPPNPSIADIASIIEKNLATNA